MTEARTCPSCRSLASAGVFCRSCGTKLPELAAASAATPTAATPATASGPAPGPPPAPLGGSDRPGWLPAVTAGVVVVALATAAAAVLLLAGGDPDVGRAAAQPKGVTPERVAQATRGLYAPSQRASYTVLLPAGWTAGRVGSEISLRDGVRAVSTQDARTSVAVGEVARPGKSLKADIETIRRGIGDQGRDAEMQPITLPGKRTAWRMTWDDGTRAGVAYTLTSCGRHHVVLGRTASAGAVDLRPRFGLIASTLQATC